MSKMKKCCAPGPIMKACPFLPTPRGSYVMLVDPCLVLFMLSHSQMFPGSLLTVTNIWITAFNQSIDPNGGVRKWDTTSHQSPWLFQYCHYSHGHPWLGWSWMWGIPQWMSFFLGKIKKTQTSTVSYIIASSKHHHQTMEHHHKITIEIVNFPMKTMVNITIKSPSP